MAHSSKAANIHAKRSLPSCSKAIGSLMVSSTSTYAHKQEHHSHFTVLYLAAHRICSVSSKMIMHYVSSSQCPTTCAGIICSFAAWEGLQPYLNHSMVASTSSLLTSRMTIAIYLGQRSLFYPPLLAVLENISLMRVPKNIRLVYILSPWAETQIDPTSSI